MGMGAGASDDRRFVLASILVTNALPLAGVVILEWSVVALVAVYWAELGIVTWWALAVALVAEQPSEYPDSLLFGAFREKRGGISLPRTDLAIRAHNVGVVGPAALVLGAIWLSLGFVGLDSLVESSAATGRATVDGTAVALCVVGVFANRGVSVLREYVGEKRYLEVSAQSSLRAALRSIIVLGSVVLVVSAVVDGAAAGPVTLVGLACGKFALDLADAYAHRIHGFGAATDPPSWEPVDSALDRCVATVRPRRLAVVTAGIGAGARSSLGVYTGLFAGLFALLGAFAREPRVLALVVPALVAVALLGALDRAIRYGSMEYRLGEDVVAVDRLLGRPQWRAPGRSVLAVRAESGAVDRLLGTETVVVELPERAVRLAHLRLRDASTVRDALERAASGAPDETAPASESP